MGTSTLKMRVLLGGVLAVAVLVVGRSLGTPCHEWLHFAVYSAIVLLASGLKVAMPGGESTVSINFPFILLAIIETSLPQALLIAGASVLVQCLDRQRHKFTPSQIAFNVGNAINATAAAWWVYRSVFSMTRAFAPAVAAAALVYAIVNMATVARMVSWAANKRMVQVWRQGFIDCIPYYLIAAAMATVVAMLTVRFGWLTAQLIFPVAWACYRTMRVYTDKMEDRKRHMEQLTGLHLRTIEALAMAIEAKDQNTHDHLCRVRVYVGEIGAEMKLDEAEMQALEAAALLHDIGKLAVPEYIINKPGKLTPDEFDKMKIHPAVGAEILDRVGFPYPVVPVVRAHHERWDGKGYPDGLRAEEIPIGARILSAVDCFDALASDRPYRRAMPLDQVIDLMNQLAGSQFDPAVVAVLERRYQELELKAREESAKIIPFKTTFAVERGEAPGAGFEQNGQPNPNLKIGGSARRSVPERTPMAMIAAATHEAQMLYELSQTLGGTLSLDETLSVMDSKLRRLIAFDCFAVYLKQGDLLMPVHVSGEDRGLFLSLNIPIGEGLSGWVAQSRQPIINGNPSVEPGYEKGSVRSTRLRSALALPLDIVENGSRGEVLGVLALYCFQPEAFTKDHLRILEAMSGKAALAIEHAARLDRMEAAVAMA